MVGNIQKLIDNLIFSRRKIMNKEPEQKKSFFQLVSGIQKEETKECASCHAKIPINSKFCPECGFNNSEIICECGNKLSPGTKFCPECGKKVE